MILKITNGYDPDRNSPAGYPPIEPDVPKKYHEFVKADVLQNAYFPAEIEDYIYDKFTPEETKGEAFFVSYPKEAIIVEYNGTNIVLEETNESGKQLLPGSKTTNTVAKAPKIKNVGKKPCFVRMYLAIPSIVDDAQPNFDASKNLLHFNTNDESLVAGAWNWSTKLEGRQPGKYGVDFNCYNAKINGDAYNVYVLTYESALEVGGLTPAAIYQVYLDSKASENDIKKVNEVITNKWQIKVAIESVEVGEFADPYAAFKAQSKKSNPFG